jgi:hypothetical protein
MFCEISIDIRLRIRPANWISSTEILTEAFEAAPKKNYCANRTDRSKERLRQVQSSEWVSLKTEKFIWMGVSLIDSLAVLEESEGEGHFSGIT